MQPISRELNNLSSLLTQHQHQLQSLTEIHHTHGQPQQMSSSSSHFDPTSSSSCNDEFLEQMLSSVPSSNSSFPWADESEAAVLASKLRQHQMISNGAAAAALMQHHQMLLSNDIVDGSSFNSANPANDASVKALFSGFTGTGSLAQTSNQPPQSQGGTMNQPAVSGTSGGAPRQRVRARRGQATDPHSIAERLRRERIAERMKALQELVPNGNKTDKASMLDEIIDYVKFLQLQVKVLSMSRLGGASAIVPRIAEGKSSNGTQTASSPNKNEGLTVTENQVAKLMEQDMGSAMQYLQGKGLCLMPISLATAISSATRNPFNTNGGPTSPSISGLTVQSATIGNSVSNP